MKRSIILICSAFLSILMIQACQPKNSPDKTTAVDKAGSLRYDIIGKTASVTFPQFSVEESITSDSTLHWKIVDKKGMITESNEKISYKKINESQFFLSWIEKTGLTVSQVLDAKKGTAVAFVSRTDEKSDRGKRSANFLEGTFKINN